MSTVGIIDGWKRRDSIRIPPLTWPCATVAYAETLGSDERTCYSVACFLLESSV
jgi:hypothetical protein